MKEPKVRRGSGGFTLVEAIISTTLFAAAGLYVFSTFAGVTASSQTVTTEIDLSSQSKRVLSQVFGELQATSLAAQDTDGVDSTDPVPVFTAEDDTAAPLPHTAARLLVRTLGGTVAQEGENWALGKTQMQAREKVIARNKRIRFRKVVGYQFQATKGTIVPEWSNEITYSVDRERRLVRSVAGGPTKIVGHHVDALDAEVKPDGTVVLTLVCARPMADGSGWKRYANAVTVQPKN